MTMRFGVFIPQGWRLDLVGIDPAEQWNTMSRLAQRAEAGPWESIWVYDHFHTTPDADRRGDARGVDADGRLRRQHQPGPARPDVHLHGVPEPCLPGQGRRDGRRHLRRPGRDGHRRRAGTSRNGAPTATDSRRRRSGCARSTRACRSCGRPGPPARRRCRARSIRSTARSSGRCRCSRAASRSGSPAAARRSPCGSPRSTRDYTNFDGTPEGFRHKSEVLAGHCRPVGPDFDAITRSANYNIAIGRDEKEVAGPARLDPGPPDPDGRRGRGPRDSCPGSAACRASGTPEQIVEKLSALKSDGLSYAIANFPELAYDTSGLELFEQEVIPALR